MGFYISDENLISFFPISEKSDGKYLIIIIGSFTALSTIIRCSFAILRIPIHSVIGSAEDLLNCIYGCPRVARKRKVLKSVNNLMRKSFIHLPVSSIPLPQ